MDEKIRVVKLSVIIPVYNAEKFLDKCIASLFKQTHKNMEIILVDDGSSDKSHAMCDEYAVKDERVKVVHQKNGGPSKARNTGLKLATGEYIAFMDADDWAEPEFYEKMLNVALEHNADYVKCGFCHTDGKKKDYVKPDSFVIYEGDSTIQYYFKGLLSVLVWNAVYRADLAKKVNYPEGYGFEDNYVCFFYLYYAQKLVIVPYTDYNYYYNNAGQSSRVRSDDKFELTERLRKDIVDKGIKLPLDIQKEMDFIWAKDWFHKIRDDKKLKCVNNEILQDVCKALDVRRSLQLRAILLKRKFWG